MKVVSVQNPLNFQWSNNYEDKFFQRVKAVKSAIDKSPPRTFKYIKENRTRNKINGGLILTITKV